MRKSLKMCNINDVLIYFMLLKIAKKKANSPDSK